MLHASLLLGALLLQTPDPTLSRLAEVRAPAGLTGGSFGFSVAIEGDVLVVGDPRSDLAGPDWGAAFVYRKDTGGTGAWGLSQTLLPTAGGFGGALALDGGRLVVGAGPLFPVVSADVHVYSLVGARFVLEAAIPDPFPGYGTAYGRAVAVEGDVIAISTGNHSCYTSTGPYETVFVHERDAGGSGAWGQVAAITTPFPGSYFAHGIALENDILVINEPWRVYPCQGFFSPVYLHRRDAGGPGNWGAETELAPEVARSGFGFLLEMSGDLVAATDYEGVAIFDRNAGGPNAWLETRFLELTFPLEKVGMALEGRRLFVGVQDAISTSAGSVLVYERHLGGENAFGLLTVLSARTPVPGDGFGQAIAAGDPYVAVSAFTSRTVHVFGPRETARGRSSPRRR